jgi:hypothetical protein
LTFLAAGLAPFIVRAQDATPTPAPDAAAAQIYGTASPAAQEPTGDNSYCVVCHNQPLQTVTMQDGNILNLYVSPDVIAGSVHGAGSPVGALGCVDCHGADSFPHDGPTPVNQREYTLRSVSFCVGCHIDQVNDLQNGLHEIAILNGDTAAAVCTDCHGVHDTKAVEDFPELVAGVCGTCHDRTLVEWRGSAHVDIGPLNCATCHSPHSQRLRVGRTSDELCSNCHEEMPDVFSHVQHLVDTTSVECVDCHMFAPEPPADAPQLIAEGGTGGEGIALYYPSHTMLVETVACNTCHENLVISGEWETIRTAEQAAEGEGAVSETGSEAEAATDEASAASAGDGFIQLAQGLILGLGFGITIASIFIARGSRRVTNSTEED